MSDMRAMQSYCRSNATNNEGVLIPTPSKRNAWTLPIIVVAQVLVTSTWFAANSVATDMGKLWSGGESVSQITLMVQLGFILGTLGVAATGTSDRMSGRRLFCFSALIAAATNAAILVQPGSFLFVLGCRFCTGVALAGVYPVGMKLAASWYESGLGRALGYLVGALVLGTSMTHLIRALQVGANWQYVLVTSSCAAMIGSVLIAFVPDGPYLKRAQSQRFQLSKLVQAWEDRKFRQAALAYFGHMWELYAFWAFMPRWLQSLGLPAYGSSSCAFAVIAVGAMGCVMGGIVAERFTSRAVARFFLAISCLCCLVSPLLYDAGAWSMMSLLLVWGIAVVGDSPQLSSLNAQSAPRHLVGSALTATTCIGFSITVLSLMFLDWISVTVEPRYLFLPLALGPLLGVVCLSNRMRPRAH